MQQKVAILNLLIYPIYFQLLHKILEDTNCPDIYKQLCCTNFS